MFPLIPNELAEFWLPLSIQIHEFLRRQLVAIYHKLGGLNKLIHFELPAQYQLKKGPRANGIPVFLFWHLCDHFLGPSTFPISLEDQYSIVPRSAEVLMRKRALVDRHT